MKRVVTSLLAFVVLLGGAGLWTTHVRESRWRRCESNMEQLYSAAVSDCLQNKLKPDMLLGVEELELGSFVRPGDTVCPSP